MLSAARRRELGSFYTPADVAARLVAIALDDLGPAARVCDPACGDGAFLLAAGRALAAAGGAPEVIARDLLWGADIDAGAVAAARAAIVAWSGVDAGDHLVVADGLRLGERWPAPFDAVVGNPPFLNQLEQATVRDSGALPPQLAALAGPYTDTAWLFLASSLELVHGEGRVVLVQPQSLLAARDAARVRDAVAPRLRGLWWCAEPLFDASVRVCAPVLGSAGAMVERWHGRDVAPIKGARPPRGSTWSPLVPSDVPVHALPSNTGTLADLATATAGFRDQFYGLAPHVVDEPDGDDPLLITSGLIDVGGVSWGARTTRFHGRVLRWPRVRLDGLPEPLATWVRDRLAPKVVLATQTRVLEAAIDEHGRWVPSTPVIAVQPVDPSDVWRVGALLTAPAVSAWAATTFAGAALSPSAIKLSAKQALTIGLPADARAWTDAADALRAGDVDLAAELMNGAYGASDAVLAWWRARR
jgi:hypothetical protein